MTKLSASVNVSLKQPIHFLAIVATFVFTVTESLVGCKKYDRCSGDGFKIFPESLKLFLGHHLASLDIVGVEENVVARNKMARWTSDL